MTTWSDACEAAASRLERQYRQHELFEDDFWFGANALHAYLESRLALKTTDNATGLLRYAYEEVYLKLRNKNPWWYDDYGWWGNAFCLAVKRRRDLGFSERIYDGFFTDLQAAAVYCWTQQDSYWRDKPYSATNDNARSNAEIVGGTFNDHPDDSLLPMSGRNCVTNSGFWLLSWELFRLTSDKRYLARADDEGEWYTAWLERQRTGTGPGVLTSEDLVLERPTGHLMARDWHWTGDQGLFVKAYLWHLRQAPPLSDSLAARVAESTMRRMIDDQGVLHEDMSFYRARLLKGFLADYATGKGIFLRNLSDVTETYFQEPWTQQNALPFFRANAAAVWRYRDPATGQLPFNWNPDVPGHEPHRLVCLPKTAELCDLILQASGLDALSAAVRYLPGEEVAERAG